MIELGYTTKLLEVYRSAKLPEELFNAGEKGYIERFHSYENWEKLSFNDRILWRKGKFVHEKKVSIAFDHYLEYFQELIHFTDLIMVFLEKTEPILIDNKDIILEGNEITHLFRLHAFLYCELYSILKNEEIEKIKHTLHPDLLTPVLDQISKTKYYSEYRLSEVDKVNQKVRELYLKISIG